jgi:hypothetical protein
MSLGSGRNRADQKRDKARQHSFRTSANLRRLRGLLCATTWRCLKVPGSDGGFRSNPGSDSESAFRRNGSAVVQPVPGNAPFGDINAAAG